MLNSVEIKTQEEIIQEKINQKQFHINNMAIGYLNRYQINITQNNLTDNINVKNFLCYQQGNKLKKVTDITFQNRIIRIQDEFQLKIDINDPILKARADSIKQAKIQMLKRRPKFVDQGKFIKRDTKNIVKNLVKLFLNWLKMEQSPNQIVIQNIVAQMVQKVNYNNRLIKNFAENETINPIFLYFCENVVKDMIITSKIHDKQSHQVAAQFYITYLKKKNRNQSKQQNSTSTGTNQQN